jgi:hypothetical protein
MIFLRITTGAGVRTYIPDNAVLQVVSATDSQDAGSSYRAPNVVRGKLTEVKYLNGANAAAPTITAVAAIPAYTTGGTLYEYGMFNFDGSFAVMLSN